MTPPTSAPASPTEATVEPDTEPTAILEPSAELAETDSSVDPIDTAAAALDAPRASRRSTRKSRRAEAREQRRAEKESRIRPAPAEALVARLPEIKPVYAAVLTGLLSGLAAVGLAFGSAEACEAARGTSSCGGGLGLLAVVAILALEVLIGANLLKAWRISDPFSTSFLGVGLVATIAMLTFLDELDSQWMLLVIPLMTATSFALSWWVTVRFIDEYDEGGPPDEREQADVAQDEDSNA